MRQLKLSRQHTDPSWEADRAQALPLLRSLATEHPLPLLAAAEEQLLRFIVAMATQYRGRGTEWDKLLHTGYLAAAEYLVRQEGEAKYLGWWVRQGIAKLISETDEIIL